MVALWAYTYEFENISLVDDGTFDRECRLVDSSISTGHAKLDLFFRDVFHPDTGIWIHQHPELNKVAALYERLRSTGIH